MTFNIHIHASKEKEMNVQNIDRKILALQEAEVAMLSLNSHLGKDYFPPETLAMISELKVDLHETKSLQNENN